MIGIRLVFFLAFAAIALFLFIRIPRLWRIVGLSISVALLLIVGFFLLQGTRSDLAEQAQLARTPLPSVQAAPTRLPPQPSYESACRHFRLFAQDVEEGKLFDLTQRESRADEVRGFATFRGSPPEFMQMIDAYAFAVDDKYGQDGAINGSSADSIVEYDRAIRRARDEMFTECRSREG